MDYRLSLYLFFSRRIRRSHDGSSFFIAYSLHACPIQPGSAQTDRWLAGSEARLSIGRSYIPSSPRCVSSATISRNKSRTQVNPDNLNKSCPTTS
ncbi:hypothetical protein Bca101_101865 [Brassica carinata]